MEHSHSNTPVQAPSSFTSSIGSWLQKLRECPGIFWRLEARLKHATLGNSVRIIGRPILSVAPGSTLSLGNHVVLSSSLRSNPLGCFQPCVLRTLTSQSKLILENNVGMSGTVLCAGLEISVGEGTIFGSGAMVFDNDFHFSTDPWTWGYDPGLNAKPVRIGRGCFIGARAIILKGVTLGDRAIVGAGAVVTKDVPAGHIAVGNPARNLPPAPPGAPGGPPGVGPRQIIDRQ